MLYSFTWNIYLSPAGDVLIKPYSALNGLTDCAFYVIAEGCFGRRSSKLYC